MQDNDTIVEGQINKNTNVAIILEILEYIKVQNMSLSRMKGVNVSRKVTYTKTHIISNLYLKYSTVLNI